MAELLVRTVSVVDFGWVVLLLGCVEPAAACKSAVALIQVFKTVEHACGYDSVAHGCTC